MKSLLQLLLLVLFSLSTMAQTGIHGGPFHFENNKCITDEARALLNDELAHNLHLLESQGIISTERSNQITPFIWPIRQAEGFNYNNVYGISNYVDTDQSSGSIQDYHCGDRSYDGHRGTDIFLWPYQWHMVADNQVEVIAAAPGIIFGKQTGSDSYNCVWGPGLSWNAIFIRHADNSTTWYGHMKQGSLTSKGIGDAVEAGEYLGVVASSGYSTGPHLHFEAYDPDGNLIDPYSGNCNPFNGESHWIDQKPYREPAINAVMTHSATPVFTSCEDADNPVDNFVESCFSAGDLIYLAAYYHDQEEDLPSEYKIYRPDNSIYMDWTHASPTTYNASFWYWSEVLPMDAANGEWHFEVTFNGETVSHSFYVGGAATITAPDNNFVACEGESINLSASSGAAYLWSTGATTQTIEAMAAGNYDVTVTTAGGCELTASETVSIQPLPQISTINGEISTVPFSTETYSVDGLQGSTYNWEIIGGAEVAGGNTSSIQVLWDEVENGQVCVTETDVNGCVGVQLCLDVMLTLVSTSEIEALNTFHIFPNPTTTNLLVDLELKRAVDQMTFSVYNTLGQQMAKRKIENIGVGKLQQKFDVANWNAGVYWLTMQVGDKVTSRRILKF